MEVISTTISSRGPWNKGGGSKETFVMKPGDEKEQYAVKRKSRLANCENMMEIIVSLAAWVSVRPIEANNKYNVSVLYSYWLLSVHFDKFKEKDRHIQIEKSPVASAAPDLWQSSRGKEPRRGQILRNQTALF